MRLKTLLFSAIALTLCACTAEEPNQTATQETSEGVHTHEDGTTHTHITVIGEKEEEGTIVRLGQSLELSENNPSMTYYIAMIPRSELDRATLTILPAGEDKKPLEKEVEQIDDVKFQVQFPHDQEYLKPGTNLIVTLYYVNEPDEQAVLFTLGETG